MGCGLHVGRCGASAWSTDGFLASRRCADNFGALLVRCTEGARGRCLVGEPDSILGPFGYSAHNAGYVNLT